MLYPIGIQDFEKLRRGGFVYVDKTAFIHQLAHSGSGYYFLSRPRRFGKSLIVTTLEAYFRGKRELFKGLAIEKLETEWTAYPVLHLDLNAEVYERPEELINKIDLAVSHWEEVFGTNPKEQSLSTRFAGVINRAYEKTGQKVVILIDEYDKPLLEAIGNNELTAAYRSTLSAFYSVMKSQDSLIKFVFITGVTKFSKVSIFSGLNNLRDISMDRPYSTICGITETELHNYFSESVTALAAESEKTEDECYVELKKRYDGYHFSEKSEGVYNPFSLLNAFAGRRFGNFWFQSGTPTFLTKVIQNADYNLTGLKTAKVTADDLGSTENPSNSPIPVLYQAGYLTISGYYPEYETYSLAFPNREVELGFMRYLLPTFVRKTDIMGGAYIERFVTDVRSGNPDGFMTTLKTLFAGNSYKVQGDKEIYFQNVMYVVFRLMGFYTQVERTTSEGRIDLTIETADYIYIVEIKRNGSAEVALRQIEAKHYAEPFAMDPRKLFKIGVNFSSRTRGITEWKIA